MKWQDISTAPKDGTSVDLWLACDFGDYRLCDCKWGTPDGEQEAGWMHLAPDEVERFRYTWRLVDFQPSHWMHRPDPPKGDAS